MTDTPTPKQQRTLLCIDGGGIRGLLSAQVLQHVEERLAQLKPSPHHFSHRFDMLAGTSSGALIALGLAKGLSAQQLVGIFEQHAGHIFSSSGLGKLFHSLLGNSGAAHTPGGYEKVLASVLDNATLGTLGASYAPAPGLSPADRPYLMCTSYDTQQATTRLFKSWKAGHGDLLARDVARASSAAPTYFPPKVLYVPQSSPDDPPPEATLVDGGLFANNPAMCAWAEAQKLWPGDDIHLLSVSTGELVPRLAGASTRFWTTVEWLKPTISAMFDGQSDAVHYQLTELYASAGNAAATAVPPPTYLRLQTELHHAQNDELDNIHPMNLMGLKADADHLVRTKCSEIDAFISTAF